MKKHPLLTAAAAAGTAVLGAAYGIYRVAFYQKPTTAVPSPADMPTVSYTHLTLPTSFTV